MILNKLTRAAISAGVILALGLATGAFAQDAAKLPVGAVVISGGYADVTGDGVTDEVILMGKRAQADADFMSEHGLFVTEGKEGKTFEKWLGPESAGYPGQVTFGRLNPGASIDMLLEFPSGGSGGSTTALPVSMEGGEMKYLADIYLLNGGPNVDLLVNDNYKLVAKFEGIEYTLDLLNGKAKDEEGTYKGIFDESGRKVGTLKPALDSVSSTELSDLNGDGIFEIVTYRAIWAVFHANSVGFARSTWGWEGDSIKPRFVSVKPNFTPADFVDYVNSIESTDPIEVIKSAAAKYQSAFEAAPALWRYEAFMIFRSYQEAVADKITQSLPSVQGADDATMQKIYEYADKLAAAGIGVYYVGEGRVAAIPDPMFQIRKFEKFIPKEAVEFLLLDAVEVYDIWAMDGALTIQMEEVGNRLHDWEYFLMSHPGSPFTEYAMSQYVSKLAAFLLGIDQSPNFSYSDGTINPGVLASLEKYARENSGDASANIVVEALGIMREGRGKLTQQLIDRIIDLLPKPVPVDEVKP